MDFACLVHHIQERYPKTKWLNAIIDAVPGMPTVPPWGHGNIIKWFSEYELLGNWATYRGRLTIQPQIRYEYNSLHKISEFTAKHNAVCDAIPDLSQSMQIDWDTLEIPQFDILKEKVEAVQSQLNV